MPEVKAKITGTFSKFDDEKQLAFGWAYVAEDDGKPVVDHSGDFIDKAALPALEDAFYDYVLTSREADEMHENFENVAKLVESVVVTPEKLEAMGLQGNRTGVWVGYKIADPDVWAKVKDGTYPGFSIRGAGTREAATVA